MVKWIIAAILLLPLMEIAAFIFVAALVGLPLALLLVIATSLIGWALLRRAGRGQIARLKIIADTGAAGLEAGPGGILLLAGLLLFLPGFLTDLVGTALLIGPVRRFCGGIVQRLSRAPGRRDRSTVDLAPGEWEQVPDRELPNPHRRDRD